MGIRSSVRRHPSVWAAGAAIGVALVVFVLVWFEPQQLFLDQKVDEAAPTAPTPPAAAQPSSPGTSSPAAPEPGTGTTGADPTTAPSDPPGTTAPPSAQLEVLARGEFRGLEHSSTGTAKLLRLPNGDRYLRFEDLDTSNGPDLVVYLSPRPTSDDWHGWDQGAYLDLGSLKGNIGDQNYLLPADADLSNYESAVIWCQRFKVGFAVAPLDQRPV